MSGAKIDRRIDGRRTAAISDLIDRLVIDYAGPVPTKTRTYVSEDVITVVLQVALTKGELRLVGEGETELVLITRRAFQKTIREDLVAGIEEITGRKVFMSAHEMEPDIAVETFLLDGLSSTGARRDDESGHWKAAHLGRARVGAKP